MDTKDTKKKKPKTKDNAAFMKELEDRLRRESKPLAPDNSQLVKAAEDWFTARGFDPYKSGQTIHLDLLFNCGDSGECELTFRVSE